MPRVGSDIFELLVQCTTGEAAGLPEDMALQVIAPIVSALCHLNGMGFAHRDVKSENILVEFRRNPDTGLVTILDVRLIDFDTYVFLTRSVSKSVARSSNIASLRSVPVERVEMSTALEDAQRPLAAARLLSLCPQPDPTPSTPSPLPTHFARS